MPPNKAFTLVELLIVIAIIAILSVVVIMAINPVEMLRKARDSNRSADLNVLNKALSIYNTDQPSGSLGSATIVYVSLPDSSATCANLGLPTLPIGYTYACATTVNYRKTDGTGWVPVSFTSISAGAPFGTLPIDPVNTTSTGLYYTYIPGGSWIVTAIPESQKQRTALASNPNIPNYPGVMAMGNNLSLSPLYNSTGLVGYWNFDEGTGNTTSTDRSGYGNNGKWYGSGAHYATGKVGSWMGQFNGTDDYVDLGVVTQITPDSITISAWTRVGTLGVWNGIISNMTSWGTGFSLQIGSAQGIAAMVSGTYLPAQASPSTGVWYHIVATHDSSTDENIIYLNGARSYSATRAVSYEANAKTYIGAFYTTPNLLFNGQLDDVRIYNRALSAAEVLAIYNATR